MNNVIITGANGFLGRKLVQQLQEEGVECTCLIQQGTMDSTLPRNSIEFDLDQVLSIQKKLPTHADCLYHLAWRGVGTNHKNEDVQLKNIMSCYEVMHLAQALGVKRVIMPGSASEYGFFEGKMNPGLPPSPTDLYAACKVGVHYICDIYAKQHGIEFVWAPITSIYGPGRNDNNIITYTIRSLYADTTPRYTSLKQVWDYIYADDLITALCLLGKAESLPANVYMIGSGEVHPLSYYIETIRDVMRPGAALAIGALPNKGKQLDHSILDISPLQNDTGFVPQYSFQEGITQTIAYFKKILDKDTRRA